MIELTNLKYHFSTKYNTGFPFSGLPHNSLDLCDILIVNAQVKHQVTLACDPVKLNSDFKSYIQERYFSDDSTKKC